MHQTKKAALALSALLAGALTLSAGSGASGAVPGAAAPGDTVAVAPSSDDDSTSYSDDLTLPWQERYAEIRQAALEQRLRQGGTGTTEKLSKGVYGKVAQTETVRIFTVLTEFGDERHPDYPDGEFDEEFPEPQRYDGPSHNEIPKPDRSVDNSTQWQKDYNKAHFKELYFERMNGFYQDQSIGKFGVDGAVTDWVKVPFNEARYGRKTTCSGVVCSNIRPLLRDSVAFWTQEKLDAGWTMSRIQNYLKTFDIEDRYDFDGDGDFNEPDGYIDHFQVVHAGGDAADGDPVYGGDAIWSHRSYAAINPPDSGPEGGAQLGGFEIGQGGTEPTEDGEVVIPDNKTGVWVGDYTMQPENGGLSVFAHEFAHDLGLPDLYDTSGNQGGASNSVEHWSLMAQSRGTAKGDPGIGDRPMPFGAWEKFQLGWLDYETARAGRTSTHKIRPGQLNTGSAANGVIVLLPDKEVPVELGAPCDTCGERYYYSDQGDDLNTTMTREVDSGGPLTAKVNYEIEDAFDYAFLEVSSDGGETWDSIETSESYEGDDESGVNPDGTGISGTTEGEWVDLTATVPAGTDTIRWRYYTDGAFVLSGFRVDNMTLGGADIGTAETGDEGWELDGFRTTTGSEVENNLNAYFVDNRQYLGRDRTLDHIYNFGYTGRKIDKVDFFSYAPGALISYWDTSYADNNVGDHPGAGEILPVDAHPNLRHHSDGTLIRTKVQTYDSTFSQQRARRVELHYQGEPYALRGQAGQPKFNDLLDYWYDSDEHGSGQHVGRYQPGWFGVDVPKTGTTVEVLSVSKSGVMTVRVGTSN